jgi:predicted nucleic acid-binding protein
MIYVDTSVILAELLAEDRRPPEALWRETLVSSRLLECEVWTRLNSRRLGATHGESARALIDRLALLEMVSPVLQRALDPFPVPLRTLDAIHLASLLFLRERRVAIRLATYDERLAAAAEALHVDRFAV